MQRCPACNARLPPGQLCPRCGADLGRALHCEFLSKLWLTFSIQMLNADQADIAIAAVERSLSFKQTQAARLFRDFLVQHQYRALYECLAQKHWSAARQTLVRLHLLLGDNESLSRFRALLEHLSKKPG
jgi:hypothetical protein